MRDGVDGKTGLLLGSATKQFRSIVQDTLLPNLVAAVRCTDSVWSTCWGSFRSHQKELRQSLRDWVCSSQRCQSPFVLDPGSPSSGPEIDLSPQYGSTKNITSPARSPQLPRARAIPQSPRQVARLLARKLGSGPLPKGFSGKRGRGGRKDLLPGGYISPALRAALRKSKSDLAAQDIASSTLSKT